MYVISIANCIKWNAITQEEIDDMVSKKNSGWISMH